MLVFQNGKELSSYITEKTGTLCFYVKRSEKSEDHFIIDDISDDDTFADNRVHSYFTNVQVSFFTKSPYRRKKYTPLMKELFACTSNYTFESSNEWYQTIYEFQVKYKDG